MKFIHPQPFLLICISSQIIQYCITQSINHSIPTQSSYVPTTDTAVYIRSPVSDITSSMASLSAVDMLGATLSKTGASINTTMMLTTVLESTRESQAYLSTRLTYETISSSINTSDLLEQSASVSKTSVLPSVSPQDISLNTNALMTTSVNDVGSNLPAFLHNDSNAYSDHVNTEYSIPSTVSMSQVSLSLSDAASHYEVSNISQSSSLEFFLNSQTLQEVIQTNPAVPHTVSEESLTEVTINDSPNFTPSQSYMSEILSSISIESNEIERAERTKYNENTSLHLTTFSISPTQLSKLESSTPTDMVVMSVSPFWGDKPTAPEFPSTEITSITPADVYSTPTSSMGISSKAAPKSPTSILSSYAKSPNNYPLYEVTSSSEYIERTTIMASSSFAETTSATVNSITNVNTLPTSTYTTVYYTHKFSVAFDDGTCYALQHAQRIVLEEFWAEVCLEMMAKFNVTKESIRPIHIKCDPLRLIFELRTTLSIDNSTRIIRKMIEGGLLVSVSLNGKIVSYKANSVVYNPTENQEKIDPYASIGLSQIDVIVISSVCAASLVLVFIGFVICIREYYNKHRTRSFDLSDIGWDSKEDNYTLTKIPRPHMTYSDNGVVTQSLDKQQSCRTKEGARNEDNHVHDVLLRVNTDENGLTVGLTGTKAIHHDSHSNSYLDNDQNDQSKDLLVKPQDSSLHSMDNPIYFADDDSFS